MCKSREESPPRAPQTRPARTAVYDWGLPPATDQARHLRLVAEATQDDRLLPPREVIERWHARAEALMREACRLGLAETARGQERDKGSLPEQRPVAPSAARRGPETVRYRRLCRLQRVLEESWKSAEVSVGGPPPSQAPAPGALLRRWVPAFRSGLLPAVPFCLGGAADILRAEVSAEESRMKKAAVHVWKGRFKRWGPDAARAAAQRVKPPPAPVTFSAADMRAEWSRHWCPGALPGPPLQGDPGPGRGREAGEVVDPLAFAEAWTELADAAGVPVVHPPHRWIPPSRAAFRQQVANVAGSAGLDGWEASEAKALVEHAPWLVDELHDLFVAAAEASVEGDSSGRPGLLPRAFPRAGAVAPAGGRPRGRPLELRGRPVA
ncbi:unnamed protein product [Prorocentrum cordatum]|uniref:Uncharacterized protein n=1 Tax=Prorocentrum cordatum TaxID=2364126 RepID=A0ABN9TUW2_9DINO|nr:unnamed protein product [Polarella glacialis]